MSYLPCGRDVDPCEHVGNCVSDSTLICKMEECGGCSAKHYDQSGRPVDCQGRLSGMEICQIL